jgi:hypothetical protein
MTPDELTRKAHELIIEKLLKDELVDMDWTTHELISLQGEITGTAVQFFMWAAQQVVYQVVKDAVDKYKQPQQLGADLFEEYVDLRQAYTVERNKKRYLVPIHLLTDQEIIDRAKELRKQGNGSINHAAELERYLADRRRERAA